MTNVNLKTVKDFINSFSEKITYERKILGINIRTKNDEGIISSMLNMVYSYNTNCYYVTVYHNDNYCEFTMNEVGADIIFNLIDVHNKNLSL